MPNCLEWLAVEQAGSAREAIETVVVAYHSIFGVMLWGWGRQVEWLGAVGGSLSKYQTIQGTEAGVPPQSQSRWSGVRPTRASEMRIAGRDSSKGVVKKERARKGSGKSRGLE